MDAITKAPDAILSKYLAMSETECREAIFALKTDIGERLLHLGKAVLSWKMNGRDLDELGLNGMTPWLLKVGGDQLYAPLVARFIREREMVRRLSALPFEEQKHIGDGGKVDLLVIKGGEISVLSAALAEMEEDQLKQVLAPDHIRNQSEQRIWLEQKRARAMLPVPASVGPFEIDAVRGVAVFKGRRGDVVDLSSAEAMVEALRRAMKRPPDGPAR